MEIQVKLQKFNLKINVTSQLSIWRGQIQIKQKLSVECRDGYERILEKWRRNDFGLQLADLQHMITNKL